MILGGVVGYGVSFLRTPSYQATVYLTTAIDNSQTGSLEELEADRMLGITEDILTSDAVLSPVCQMSPGCEDLQVLRTQVQIERTIGLWALSAFSDDAVEAVRLARLWLKTGHAALLERQTHALQAEMLSRQLEGLTACVQDAADGHPPVICSGPDMETLLTDIRTMSEHIQDERQLSGGISPAILFGPLNLDHIQLRDLNAAPGLLSLLGAFAGLLLSILLLIFRSSQIGVVSPLPEAKPADEEKQE